MCSMHYFALNHVIVCYPIVYNVICMDVELCGYTNYDKSTSSKLCMNPSLASVN
jgi:hypothetical protein